MKIAASSIKGNKKIFVRGADASLKTNQKLLNSWFYLLRSLLK